MFQPRIDAGHGLIVNLRPASALPNDGGAGEGGAGEGGRGGGDGGDGHGVDKDAELYAGLPSVHGAGRKPQRRLLPAKEMYTSAVIPPGHAGGIKLAKLLPDKSSS